MYEPNVSEDLPEEVNVKAMSKEALAKYIEECQRELDARAEKERVELLNDIKGKILEYKELQPKLSDTDIAREIGLNIKVEKRNVSGTQQKKSTPKPPSLFYGDETLGKLTADTLSRDPWFGLLESGEIEKHRVTHSKLQEDGSWLCYNSKVQAERPDWAEGEARVLGDIDWATHLEKARKKREERENKKVSDDN
ncbi:hypothetical protein PUT72_17050 [Vibrio alginolyticus]|uniref:hypothetical protein n=1 Tax=Vibrio alginolyticus TaxID=663 RepID=UPI0022776033|nr:hypothetical protein [Vibrio alginolyticus]WAE59516.1 hypothetical protein OPR71_19795 [Vibrio alginolyticus]WDG16066.1 hypothetical protein PUT72_17050 [Vibrio alginolyticus]